MNTVTYKEKEYQVPETFGGLKAKVAIELYDLIGKITKGELTVNQYNFMFVSLVLGIPQSELENDSFDNFMKVLGDINTILTVKSNPKVNDELEAPAVE